MDARQGECKTTPTDTRGNGEQGSTDRIHGNHEHDDSQYIIPKATGETYHVQGRQIKHGRTTIQATKIRNTRPHLSHEQMEELREKT